MQKSKCEHKRIKRNYPFGKKTTPRMSCKDCGAVIKPKDLEMLKKDRKKKRKRW